MTDLTHELAVAEYRIDYIDKQIEYLVAEKVVLLDKGEPVVAINASLKALATMLRTLLVEHKSLKMQLAVRSRRRRALRKVAGSVRSDPTIGRRM